MDNNNKLYELRTIGVEGDLLNVIKFIQDEFIVSRQTAKRMIKPNTLLVYHLTKAEAVNHVKRYKEYGLLSKFIQMPNEE